MILKFDSLQISPGGLQLTKVESEYRTSTNVVAR